MHSADGAQFGLYDARQIIGDLVLIEVGRREANVHRGKLIVRGLQINDRRFSFWRQVIADLRHFRLNLRERRVGIVVELQVHRDRAEALSARRLHVVDTVGAGDDALQRSGDKSAYQVGVCAHVNRRNRHHRDVAARVLTHTQRANGLQPGDQDNQADDHREDGSFDKQIRELHLAVLGLGSGIISRLNLVVDLDRGAVAQLEHT